MKPILILLCITTAITGIAAPLFDGQLKAANDREIQRTSADRFWTYVRIGDYGESLRWIVGTNKMTEAAFVKHLASVTNLPPSVMLYPDYDVAIDEHLLVTTELLLWRSGVKTIRRYNPGNGTWAVKDSPSKEELDFYWRALKQMEEESANKGLLRTGDPQTARQSAEP